MLMKFFGHGGGGGGGGSAVDYLLKEEKREHALPLVLRGDPDRTVELIDGIDRQWRYTSGVLSFAPEDAPTVAEQERVMDAFERVAFAGLEPDQWDMLWVRHSHTSEGRVELHFVAPRVELESGKALNIAPPGWQATFDPLRDALNFEHGWARPDDPERAREHVHEHLREATPRLESREAIHDYLTGQVEAGAVQDRAGLVEALEEAGLEVPRQGKDYVTARDPETGDRFRLRGEIYGRDWTLGAQLERIERAAEHTAGRAAELEGSAGQAHGAGSQRDRGVDPERAATAWAELEGRVERRAAFHRERYGASQDAGHERAGEYREAAEADAAVERLERSGERVLCVDGAVGGERVDGTVAGAGIRDAGRAAERGRDREDELELALEPDGWGPGGTDRDGGDDGVDAGRDRDRPHLRTNELALREATENDPHAACAPVVEMEMDNGPSKSLGARVAAFRRSLDAFLGRGERECADELDALCGRDLERDGQAVEGHRSASAALGRLGEHADRAIRYLHRSVEAFRGLGQRTEQVAQEVTQQREAQQAQERGRDRGYEMEM